MITAWPTDPPYFLDVGDCEPAIKAFPADAAQICNTFCTRDGRICHRGPMGVTSQLRMSPPGRSPVARSGQWLASTPLGARAFRPIQPSLDRLTLRLSGGRTTFTEGVAGLPTVYLRTVGARTGLPREVPLIGLTIEDDIAVIGSNWGQGSHPAWVHNLNADPRATVSRHGRSAQVVAREAVDAEAERIWQAARQLYRGFRTYPDRTGGRVIRVFVLELVG